MSRQPSEDGMQGGLYTPRETYYETIPFNDESFPIRVLMDLESHPTENPFLGSENEKRRITWHEQLEILYISEGNLACECDFRHIVCGEGDIVIINTCEAHAFDYFEKPVRYHCIMIDPRLCGGRDDISVQKYIEPITSRRVRFHNILTGNEKARAVIEEMLADYSAAETGYELADACHMNRSYFCRQFHEITGRTAIAYVNEYRLAKARALLLTTSASITEIASATGYADSSYFTRRFKELYGISPSAMRRES